MANSFLDIKPIDFDSNDVKNTNKISISFKISEDMGKFYDMMTTIERINFRNEINMFALKTLHAMVREDREKNGI